jgi:hypothetical protein
MKPPISGPHIPPTDHIHNANNVCPVAQLLRGTSSAIKVKAPVAKGAHANGARSEYPMKSSPELVANEMSKNNPT